MSLKPKFPYLWTEKALDRVNYKILCSCCKLYKPKSEFKGFNLPFLNDEEDYCMVCRDCKNEAKRRKKK